MRFFSYIKKYRIFFGVSIALIFVAVSYGFSVNFGKAQGLPLPPFAGVIVEAIPCVCSAGVGLFIVGPTTAGAFLYEPGLSVLFPFGQIYRPGPFVVGGYIPGAVCMIGIPPACTDAFMGAGAYPGNGTIMMIGTSLL